MKTIAFAVAFLSAIVAFAAEHGEGITLNIPDKIVWKDGPPSLPKGAKMAVLAGDPKKEGPFVFRVKVPDGYRIPPHTHPKMERVTVIAGTFNIGMGKRATGLRVVVEIARRMYEKGLKATRDFLDNNPIRFDDFLPELNYIAPWVSML